MREIDELLLGHVQMKNLGYLIRKIPQKRTINSGTNWNSR